MPPNVWYDPEVALRGRVVGQSHVFSVADPDVGPAFVRHDENDAFLGRLAVATPGDCSSAASSCCADETVAP